MSVDKCVYLTHVLEYKYYGMIGPAVAQRRPIKFNPICVSQFHQVVVIASIHFNQLSHMVFRMVLTHNLAEIVNLFHVSWLMLY